MVGDEAACNRLFLLVQEDLRAMAAGFLGRERAGHTLQPSALVNEVWLRLIRPEGLEVTSRGQCVGLAARAMRQILVEHARARRRDKRGGGLKRVELDEEQVQSAQDSDLDLVSLDRALDRLRSRSEDLARLVELRFFAGLPREEVAQILGVSNATLGRQWQAAKALLAKYMQEDLGARDGACQDR